MSDLFENVEKNMDALVSEWTNDSYLNKNDLFVIGCSTSEVAGEPIGTAGSERVAEILFHALKKLQQQTDIHLAFQCCEHLNRALVIERDTWQQYSCEEVSVIPQPDAGGSMASFAYKQMDKPVVVEAIRAHAGIDIGETMIGMHLKPVVVPLRFNQQNIGNARITGARTRPKLIGGKRATYA